MEAETAHAGNSWGRIAAVTGWNFAYADWEQRLREGRSLVPDLPLFKDKADRAVRIFVKLCVPDFDAAAAEVEGARQGDRQRRTKLVTQCGLPNQRYREQNEPQKGPTWIRGRIAFRYSGNPATRPGPFRMVL